MICLYSSQFSDINLSTCPASVQKLEQIKNKTVCFHIQMNQPTRYSN